MKFILLLLLALPLCAAIHKVDVVVYGGAPGGIASAIAAARMGHSVVLLEYHNHLGGMSASGLGKSDVEHREAIGGFFREFTGKVHRYYIEKYGADSENVKLCRQGYYYEPSVAEHIFEEMLTAETRIRVFKNYRLDEVMRQANRLTGIRATNRTTGDAEEFRGTIFIDGTYEGDLAAYGGARYRLGRESRADFNELHAGVVYQDYETRAFLTGTTGEGDNRLQAYTFRLCLTTDHQNSHILESPPPGYDRTRYLGYLDDWKSGRFNAPKVMKDGVGYFAPTFGTVVRTLSLAEIPNSKTDVNMNPRPLGFPFAEENDGYPEATWQERERITERIRNITLGLLYFLQNDDAVPVAHRTLAKKYNLAKDEFTDNQNFPWQLYVREARRLVGLYTLSENDVISPPELGRARIQLDSIAAGEFPLDSFPVRKRQSGHDVALEGYLFMLDNLTRPYQIPYRIMVPETVDGLLVPVAASTTHVAFSSIRVEPTWMALGQAAGVAAHLALESGKQPRNIDAATLQRELLKQGQVITFFTDIDREDPAYAAIQYFGARGFFKNYEARSRDPLTRTQAREWLSLVGLTDLSAQLSTEPGPATRAELQALFPDSPGQETITRGQFCRALYTR